MSQMCRKCGSLKFFYQQKGFQVGLFCENCGAWQKWVSKKEQSILKVRGQKILAQNVEVQLSQNLDMGLEVVNIAPENFGLEMENLNTESSNNFGSVPKQTNVDIEAEVEKRVNERLKNMKKVTKVENSVSTEDCPICNGDTMVASNGDSQVELSIFDGILTVTDKAGLKILGMYKINKCPYCGNSF